MGIKITGSVLCSKGNIVCATTTLLSAILEILAILKKSIFELIRDVDQCKACVKNRFMHKHYILLNKISYKKVSVIFLE